MRRTAILVDGGFYRKRSSYLWGKKSAGERALELAAYCQAHLRDKDGYISRHLYRVFYYDCAPIGKRSVYHPLLQANIDLDQSPTFIWTNTFLDYIEQLPKFSLRLGALSNQMHYNLRPEATRDLLAGKKSLNDLTENDFIFEASQKGVDMMIGVDIATLSYKKLVDQIILIAGDSDFIPAARLARHEGIDFILDPMWANIREDLLEHIDGLKSQWGKRKLISNRHNKY